MEQEKKLTLMRTQEIVPVDTNFLRRTRRIWGARAITVKTLFRKTILVDPYDVETPSKMAEVVFKHYGYGLFNVQFLAKHQTNKHFDPYYQCARCVREEKGKPKCNFKLTPEGGMICARNVKVTRMWRTKACLKILPTNSIYSGNEYIFQWIQALQGKKKDKMLNFWWWRGRQGDMRDKIREDRIREQEERGGF